jgi:hypothetical protein
MNDLREELGGEYNRAKDQRQNQMRKPCAAYTSETVNVSLIRPAKATLSPLNTMRPQQYSFALDTRSTR